MPSYGQTVTLQYVAWDTANNAAKTGDAGNHSLRWVKDGVAAAPTNSPVEVDAAAAPGVYRLLLTAAEASCQLGTLCGKSSTSGIAIVPVTLSFENLPVAPPGTTNGLPQIGIAPLTNLDVAVSSRSTFSGGAVSSVTSPVTVGTNNDKTGYALTSPPPTTSQIATAIWQDLIAGSDFNTTGSIGQVLKANVDAAISTRSTFDGGAVSSVNAPVTIAMTQPVPTSNTPQTVGDALNAARAQGFGRWVISGTTLSLYAADGTTVVRTFTLDSASVPTQRS
jgi:hypothetical protein